jgi:predicted dehydrogenase
MAETIRWGILGTGNIASKFAAALAFAPGAELRAVGSRSSDTARAFADRFGVPVAYGSYEALAADPEVDVIYISTPHPFHMENSLLCLDHGKAVLCEKPFTMNAREARKVIDTAREKNLFIMEAMWTRFFPAMVRVRSLLSDGAIGDVRMLSADFGYRAAFDPAGRLLNPALGGGALLDVGIYPLSLASMIFGTPNRVAALAHIGETQVDEQSAVILGYDAGELALLYTAVRTETPHEATIMGTEGMIRVPDPWWHPSSLIRVAPGGSRQVDELPFEGNGMQFEAMEVMRCMLEGRLESEIMPLDETLSILTTMDEIRAQCELVYPADMRQEKE